MELLRGLPAAAEREVLPCTDLQAEDILAAQRGPWLVIDPKPDVGDPAYDPLRHMLISNERLAAGPGDLALAARRSGSRTRSGLTPTG
jgi:streptomycin 6-kinase